ncbi:hypothetical protein FQR65_LT04116 [Abscondita terminalis]|nr:hypothetical protein FQR65_LT04116 [Abscondita terminalis]
MSLLKFGEIQKAMMENCNGYLFILRKWSKMVEVAILRKTLDEAQEAAQRLIHVVLHTPQTELTSTTVMVNQHNLTVPNTKAAVFISNIGEECDIKFRNLEKTYKRIKDNNNNKDEEEVHHGHALRVLTTFLEVHNFDSPGSSKSSNEEEPMWMKSFRKEQAL